MSVSVVFTKCKFTSTNLITYIDVITPSVRSLCQAGDSLFHFDLRTSLSRKLFETSNGYVNWFRN